MVRVDVAALADGVRAGQRRALAQAITLVESTRADHRGAAMALLADLGAAETSVRLGITGVPGAGKSTFIEAFGRHAIAEGRRVAVLSIDPSSARSGGSILGDKTRMPELARDPGAFIRPSPAGATLGGVARRTRETMALCEAAGYDLVIVETVGVGQSETAVASMTDMFVLLLVPAGGDELQGIKRGIVELADLVLVNKADGDLLAAAGRAASDYAHAFRLIRPRLRGWTVRVQRCSALQATGIQAAWRSVQDFVEATRASGAWQDNRARQARDWLWREASAALLDALRDDAEVRALIPALEQAVMAGELLPGVAADRLVSAFRNRQAGECP